MPSHPDRVRRHYGEYKRCCFCRDGFWTKFAWINACDTCCRIVEEPWNAAAFEERLAQGERVKLADFNRRDLRSWL